MLCVLNRPPARFPCRRCFYVYFRNSANMRPSMWYCRCNCSLAVQNCFYYMPERLFWAADYFYRSFFTHHSYWNYRWNKRKSYGYQRDDKTDCYVRYYYIKRILGKWSGVHIVDIYCQYNIHHIGNNKSYQSYYYCFCHKYPYSVVSRHADWTKDTDLSAVWIDTEGDKGK